LNLKLEEGEYNFFSVAGVKWAFVNAVMLIVNLLFMDFMRLTPLLPAYYRLMGAKIGRGVQINSKGIADVSLIEIGDDSVIGGDAVVIGHLAEHGKLKLKRTVIGKRVTIGLGAVIMPGSSIGDGSLIAARSVLSKNTIVPEKTLYAGTPAKFIKEL
jgi:acetyltransferase-like isoleucine patch superfamily enzyme